MKTKLLILITLILSLHCYAQFGPQQIITEEAGNVELVVAADINGDGNMDIVSASRGSSTIAWQENLDGLGTFGPQILIAILDQTLFVAAADLDGDNDIDVFAIAPFIDLIVWYENLDGQGTFSTQQIITDEVDLPLEIIAADLDGDNDLDIASASKNDNTIAWYENTNGQGVFGSQQIVSTVALSTLSVFAADLDGDNNLDLIATSPGDKRIYWYRNTDGLGNFGAARVIVETPDFGGFISVFAIDLDGDQDMDVLSAEFGGGTLAWYENLDGLGTFGSQQLIASDLNTPRMIYAEDFDNDGDYDVLSSSESDNKVVWYENTDGLGTFGIEQVITTEVVQPRSVFSEDLDNDGDMDVISASIADSKIAWYENLTILGIEENELPTTALYPNPAAGVVEIICAVAIEKIEVYDISGRLVLHQEGNNTQIDVSKLVSGVLLVKIKTDQGIVIKKLVRE